MECCAKKRKSYQVSTMRIRPCLSLQTSLLKILITLTFSQTIQLSNGINSKFQDCSKLYNCGSLRSIGYPFYGGNRPRYCGASIFGLSCENNEQTLIWSDRLLYLVLGVDESIPKMTVARRDLFNNTCTSTIRNTTLPTIRDLKENVRILNIFYGCTSEVIQEVQIKSNVTCEVGGDGDGVFFADEFVSGVEGCKFSIVVPIGLNAYNDLWDQKITLGAALKQGFDVAYYGSLSACSTCEASGGICGSDDGDHFVCFCPQGSYPFVCPNSGKGSRLMIVSAGVAILGIGLLTFLCIWYYTYLKHSPASIPFQFPWKTNENQELEALINRFGSSTPRRYSYADIKKMTNSFKDELGKGGFGVVYKGFLSNGDPVAVKLLNPTKGNGEEFINEVVSISRTSHINVVSLLGFCFEGHHRAVLYEFMPNGSLEKYIRKKSDSKMGLEGLYQIAIGVARGLEYLHGGCNTRILHFDIKPHNILLDEDFCPKISDFGSAILRNRKESIVTTLEARGTIGYIAPEVFNRGFGVVSYKSDVYSYGMMLLEIVGARNLPINAEISNTGEAYFPDWAYQHATRNEDQNIKAEADDAVAKEDELERKMILVGLWCIQSNPSHRPPMNKVIEMLEGTFESLKIPPKPMLHSPIASLELISAMSSGTTLSSSLRSGVCSSLELKVFPS